MSGPLDSPLGTLFWVEGFVRARAHRTVLGFLKWAHRFAPSLVSALCSSL